MSVRIALASPTPLPAELVDLARSSVTGATDEDEKSRDWGHGWSVLGEVDDLPRTRSLLRGAAGRLGVDATVVSEPLASQPPRLLMMDVDSTLTTSEAIDELAEAAGVGEQVADITAQAMRGELDFASSLRARVATLSGLSASVFDEVRERTEFSPGAVELVATAKAAGVRVALVSGGFAEIVEPLVAGLGIDDITANHLEVREGRLTGRVEGPVVDRAAKRQHLLRNASEIDADLALSVAIGDGANDLDMLQAAGLGVAFCAKPVAAASAPAAISFQRLDAVCAYLRLG